ncbi:MAG: serine protease, partial [Pseudomonadota bacterium]
AEDIILRFNGRTVDTMRALPRIVAETPVGSQTAVEVWRSGRTVQLSVVVGELEEAEASGQLAAFVSDGAGVDLLGMTLSPVDRAARDRFDLTDGIEGLVVTDLDGDGPAADAGLRVGDVVLKGGQTDIRSPDDLERL